MAKLPDIQPYIDELPYDAKTKDALFKAFYDADPFAALGGVADVPKQVKQVIFNIRGKAEQGQPFDLKDISRFAATAPPPVAKEAKPVSEKVVTITKSSKPKAAPEEPPKEQVGPPDLASESLPSRPLIQPSDSAVEGVPFSEYTPASYVPTGTVRPTLDYQSEEALAEVPSLSTRYGVVRKPAPKEGRPVAAKPAAPQAPAPVASKSTAPPPIMPSIPPRKAQLEEVDAPGLLTDVARGLGRGAVSTVTRAMQGAANLLPSTEMAPGDAVGVVPLDSKPKEFIERTAADRKRLRKQEEEMLPKAPVSGVGQFSEALGSSVPFLLTGTGGAVTLGSLGAIDEAMRRLDDSGVQLDEKQRAGVILASGLLGATEALPLGRLFKSLRGAGAIQEGVSPKVLLESLFPSLKDIAKSGAKQFLAEGSQEWFAEIGQDVIQTLYGGRKLGDIGENAKEAFTTGGEVGVVLDLLTKLLGTRAGRARLRKSGVEPKEFKQFLEQDESKEFTDQQAAVDEFLKSKASAAEAAPEGEASPGTEEVVAAPAGPKSFIDEYNEDPEKVYGDLIGEIAKKQEKIDRLSKYKSNKNQVKKLQKELSILNRRKSSLDRLRSAEAEPTEEIELESPPEIPGETPALPTVEATPAPPTVPESPKPVTAPEKPVAFSTPSGTKVVDLTNNPPADKGIVAGQDYDPATDSLFNVDELGLYAVLKSREQPGSYEIWSMDDPSGPVSVVQAKDTKEAFSSFIDARPAEVAVAPPVTAEGITEPPPVEPAVSTETPAPFAAPTAEAPPTAAATPPPVAEKGLLAPEATSEDQKYQDAVRAVAELGKASASILQRRLRIGYGEAVRILDAMRREGIIGPSSGSRPQDVLKIPDWALAPKPPGAPSATPTPPTAVAPPSPPPVPAPPVAAAPSTPPAVPAPQPLPASPQPPSVAAAPPAPAPSQPAPPPAAPPTVEPGKKSPPPERRAIVQRGMNDPVTVYFKDLDDKYYFTTIARVVGRKGYSGKDLSQEYAALRQVALQVAKTFKIPESKAQELLVSYREAVIESAKGMPKQSPGEIIVEPLSFKEFVEQELLKNPLPTPPPPSQPAPVPEKPETAPQAPPVSPKPPAAAAPPTAPAPKPKTKDSEESGPVELSIKHQVGSGSGQIISKDVLVRFPNSVDVDAFRVVDSAFKKRASGEEKRQATRVEEAIAKASGVTDKTEILKILAAYRESINKLSKEIAIVEADLGELSGFEAPSIQDFSKEFVSPKRYPAISYKGKDFSPYGIYNKGTDANPIYAIGELADNGMVKSRWDDETFESVTQAAYFANRKANESPKATAAPVPTSAPPTPTPAESTPEPPVTPLEPGGGPVTVKEKAPKQVEPSEKEIQQEEKALEFAPLSDLPKRSVRISSTTEEGSQPRYTATHNGETWHTNAQVLVKGDPPGYWKPETIEQREFNLKGIIPDASTRVSEVEPMAYKHRTKLKDGSKKNELVDDEFIIMSDGGSISGDYYRYVLNKVAPDQWKTPGDDRYIAYKKGKPVAIVMRIRNANNAKYNKESVAMSLKERKDIREKELWEMSKEELQKRHALNRDNPKYKKGTEEHDTHDKIVAEAVLSGKPVPEYVVEGMGTGFRWVSDTILQRLLYREKLKAASERGEEVGAYKLYHEAEEKVKPIVLDYLERVREGENPGDIYEFVKSKLEPGPNPPGFTPEPPEIPKQEPKDKPVESPELPESPKATAAPTPPSVPPPSKPKAEPASVKEDVAKLDDEFPHLKGAFKKKEGKPTAKPKMPPATTPPNKAVSPNDINEVSVSPEGEIELSYRDKRYQAVPLFGSTKGFRFYDLKTGAEIGEIKGKGDAAEALAELLNKQAEAPAAKPEPGKTAPEIATKYIEPRTPQYRKDDNLIALKLRSDRNPVIWMNQRAKLNVFEALERNGVRGFHPTSLGTNFNKASNFYSLLDAVLAKPVGMFKGSQKQRDLLVALRDAMQEARQFSVLNGKDGGVSLINVDSPGREVLVSPESYKAFESKPESVKSFHRIFKVGAVGDLIKTFRHENVHAEMSTAVKSIPKADIDTLFKNPSIVEFSSILQRKGYSGADPYTVINELTAHVLTGDFDFFSSNGMTPESLVNAYSVVRPYILAIDKDAVVRGERFKRPGLKVSESDPAKLSGTSEQQAAKPNSNEITGAMLSTQPPPGRSTTTNLRLQEGDLIQEVVKTTEERQDLLNKVIESTAGKYSAKQQGLLGRIVEQQLSVPREQGGVEMPTRIPVSKKSGEYASKDVLIIGLNSIAENPKMLDAVINKMTAAKNKKGEKIYHGLTGLNLVEGDAIGSARQIMDRMVDNLLWLHDKMPQIQRDRARLWYDGANKLINKWSEQYNTDPQAVAGVIAVLSPQKDWYQNAEMARKVLEAYKNRSSLKWNPKMDEFLSSKDALVEEDESEALKDEGASIEDIIAKEERIKKSSSKFYKAVQKIRGKDFDELTSTYEKAVWLRAHDQVTSDRSFRILLPEGEFGDIAIIESGKNKGQRMKMAWQSYAAIEKAIDIMENASYENISDKLGTKHKVRNFYNNMLFPNSKNGHVTIDTHAVAAALLQPLSSSDVEVNDNFGGISSASTGSQGTYGLIAEAYRKAAAKRGLLAREMQSITWEAVRGLFEAKFKKQGSNKKAINDIWNKLAKGKKSDINKLREEILKAAGGMKKPTWVGQELRTAPVPEGQQALPQSQAAKNNPSRSKKK